MNPRASKPAAPATNDDPVWEAAQNAPVEPEDVEERHAVDAAKKKGGAPVPGDRVSKQIAERLRTAK
jgi:hypothetical protein